MTRDYVPYKPPVDYSMLGWVPPSDDRYVYPVPRYVRQFIEERRYQAALERLRARADINDHAS